MSSNVKVRYTKIFINNEFVDSVSKKTFPTYNPVNGTKICDVSEGDKLDINVAVKAARAAMARNSEWRQMDASKRGLLLLKFADVVERDQKDLAALETLDNGKPYEEALFDIQFAVNCLRYYAGAADKIHGESIPADGGLFAITTREPIGVCGQIIPWNYPIVMLVWKWAPALACGNAVILKPAEQTPLTALAMAALAKEVGFPKGVVNVVPGYGPTTGASLVQHPDVDKIAFTGSTEVGHKIMELVALSKLKRLSLELGGKSPLVIFDDADIDEAVQIAHFAIFANHGQCCCAGSRTFVHSKIYDEFVRKATELAKNRKVGDPFVSGTQQGPQIDQEAMSKILRYVDIGKQEGAKLQCGGERVGTKGYFVKPTVFSDVTNEMEIARNEIFGPVQLIFKFDTLDEIIDLANDTHYGLAAGVLTKNINTALIFAKEVKAGTVWVNCYDAIAPQTPFGGFKQSGLGRELGTEGLKEYLEVKTITVKLPSA